MLAPVPPPPAAVGYRMPAEWEPHEATWLSWPHPEGISFPDFYEKIPPVFSRMIGALANSERVCLNVRDEDEETTVRAVLEKLNTPLEHVTFHHFPTNEPWCRDHGPIFVVRDQEPRLAAIDWDYNAWGWKYPPFDLDDMVPTLVAEEFGLPIYSPGMVLEGGSIEVNGTGTLLTTTSCLLNRNRNPDLSKTQIEEHLRQHLGVHHFLWLGDGIEGDDTDGHIDDITRFVARDTVVTVVEEDERDSNYEPLQENLSRLREMAIEDGSPLRVLPLPMPAQIVRQGQRLPASYANYYIGNRAVLLPVFNDGGDKMAVTVLQNAFPDREVIAIDCRELIWGLGAFHCLTQQQPKV